MVGGNGLDNAEKIGMMYRLVIRSLPKYSLKTPLTLTHNTEFLRIFFPTNGGLHHSNSKLLLVGMIGMLKFTLLEVALV